MLAEQPHAQDTAIRILDPKYYGNSREQMSLGLREFYHTNKCDFIVAGRLVNGVFMEASQLQVEEEFRGCFRGIPSSAFRSDISSTVIREQMAKKINEEMKKNEQTI